MAAYPSRRARKAGCSPAGELSHRRSKQVKSPVWQATPVCSTRASSVSPSQSKRSSRTFWRCPEVPPLFHNSLTRAAVEPGEAGLESLAQRLFVHVGEHEHLAGGPFLDDARHEAARIELHTGWIGRRGLVCAGVLFVWIVVLWLHFVPFVVSFQSTDASPHPIRPGGSDHPTSGGAPRPSEGLGPRGLTAGAGSRGKTGRVMHDERMALSPIHRVYRSPLAARLHRSP